MSRTEPHARGATIREVERLFEDAIDSAERLIYVETQYFSSKRIFEALAHRMRDAQRSRLQIVLIVNERAEAIKEEIAVGLRQIQNIETLRRIAAETGHALGCYYTLPAGATDAEPEATYIHSKVMLVDDRFLTVGSANLTNRSMGIDSELHASWEAETGDGPLRRRIRRVRVSLLAEHAGVAGRADLRALCSVDGLVDRLDAIAARPGTRLRCHRGGTAIERGLLQVIDPKALPFDSDGRSAAETHDNAA